MTRTPSPVRFTVTLSDDNAFGDHYLKFTARAVVLDPGHAGPMGEYVYAPDSYSTGLRRPELADLGITAQRDQRAGSLYGWKVSYVDAYRVELADAERMVKVLRKIERRMARLSDSLGRPETLAQFCTYVARALTDADAPFLRRVDPDQDYEGTGYRSMSPSTLAYWIGQQEHAWAGMHSMGRDVEATA